jgi:hypothetical protein
MPRGTLSKTTCPSLPPGVTLGAKHFQRSVSHSSLGTRERGSREVRRLEPYRLHPKMRVEGGLMNY